MRILSFIRQYRKVFSSHRPLIEVLIHKDCLLDNLKTFQRRYPDQQIAPVLKSNAYGHGLVPVAKILDQEDIAFLVVDSIFEAAVLYKEGIKSKILVIGYTRPQEINRNRCKNVSFTLTNFAQLAELSKTLRTKQRFHLKIDTGMRRQGIIPLEIKNSISKIKKNKNIFLEGICSHFANADSVDKKSSRLQIENWGAAIGKFKKAFPGLKYFHMAATAGSHYCKNGTVPHFKHGDTMFLQNTNVIRLGLGLYGLDSSPNRSLKLKPALELRTIVSGIKIIQKGEYVGYGLTFRAKNIIKAAVVPVGYFEGIDRRLSNKGFYKIQSVFCPIIGRVSMNISVIDVSRLEKIESGDPVILISPEPRDKNSVVNIAKLCKTIPYEILVHVPQHLRRIVI